MAASKTQSAYAAIKKMIISGELAPNSLVSEEMLQSTLGMSRTPIREAIQLLTNERFLEVFPRKGIVVTDITLDLLNDIFDFREVNEPYISRAACGRVPDDVWIDLRNRFTNPPANDPKEKRQYLINLDTLLHSTILQSCTNRFLIDSMDIVLSHDQRIKHFSYEEAANDSISVPEHLAIIDSLLAHDGERVYESVLAHIKSSRQMVISRVLNKFISNHNSI